MAVEINQDEGRPCRTSSMHAAAESSVDVALDTYVEQIIQEAPPFTARQRSRIAAILNGDSPTLKHTVHEASRSRNRPP